MAQFKGVRKLSQKKYDEMKKAGTLDAGIVYVTPTKTLPVLQGTAEPTNELIGEVGQFYLDTVNKKLYQCVSVTTDETAGTTTYEWQIVGGGEEKNLYQHNITLLYQDNTVYFTLNFKFINNIATPYTNSRYLSDAIYNAGFYGTSPIKYLEATGIYHTPSYKTLITGVADRAGAFNACGVKDNYEIVTINDVDIKTIISSEFVETGLTYFISNVNTLKSDVVVKL